ncbi:hypothetical protein Taro_021787, partial [Colocasia esculenta]|nr:hypothetical protein [Colocasia esculenta]
HTNHNSVTTVLTPGHTSNGSNLDHESQTHEPQPVAKHESERKRRHHTGTDYWLIRPVSNPDNRTQEQPLSLAVTDERSNCRSTRTRHTSNGSNLDHESQTHEPQPVAKHESERKRRHHTGTDYWLIRPVSNPDNRTQEQPLSLAVTDERSNCRSTRTSPCLAPLGSLAGAP